MSRLGKQPITIPEGVKAEITDDQLSFTGPKGTVSVPRLNGVEVEIKENSLSLAPRNGLKQTRMNWGTLWSLAVNAIAGVTGGFSKTLEIEGIGFKASVESGNLVLKVGFSHLIKFPIPEGISVIAEKNKIIVTGIDKQRVGHVAASIRKIKKPEPYLGKGIRYEGEIIRRKAGKKAGAGTTGTAVK
jgi:large subunit ribosomal protein L6